MQIIILIAIVLGTAYAVMIVAFGLGIRRLKRKKMPKGHMEPISVVVAMRNEQDNVDTLLGSLKGQDFPVEDYEIIIVSDHSTDDTLLKVQQWMEKTSNLRVVNSPHGTHGKKGALALGVGLAAHDLVVFTDADCEHPKGWLSAMSAHFVKADVGMLVAPVLLSQSKGFFKYMQQLEHASLTASGLGACALGVPFMASSANLAFKKSMLEFTPEQLNPSVPSGDDVFLLHSAKKKGIKIACGMEPPLVVKTTPAPSIKEWLLQRARWASKAPSYTDVMAIGVGLLVLLANAMLLLFGVLSFVRMEFALFFLCSILAKSVVDILLLYPYLRSIRQRHSLVVFVPLQLVYPIYIIVAFTLALFTKVPWKGRG